LGTNISKNSVADFVQVANCVHLPGPYSNNSIWPPYENFDGYIAQAYTENTTERFGSNIKEAENNIEDTMKNLFGEEKGVKRYRYSNYPPTYRPDEKLPFNSLKLYFNDKDIYKITTMKRKLDASSKFISDYDIPV